jgi:hypothetical protein
VPAKPKHLFNQSVILSIAAELSPHYSQFDSARFVADCMKGLEDLELTQRAMDIAEAMQSGQGLQAA